MAKLWEDFKFGLGFGIGFLCAYGLLRLVLWIINMIASGAHEPIGHLPP